MRILVNRNLVADFFDKKLALHNSADLRGILWVPEEFSMSGTPMSMDQVAIGVAYNGFIGKTCAMHVVIQHPKYLSRKIIQTAFVYPFVQCGVEVILGLVDSTNKAAEDFDRRIGFKEVHTVRNGGLDGDLIIFQMHKADCRWLQGVKHGQEKWTACA